MSIDFDNKYNTIYSTNTTIIDNLLLRIKEQDMILHNHLIKYKYNNNDINITFEKYIIYLLYLNNNLDDKIDDKTLYKYIFDRILDNINKKIMEEITTRIENEKILNSFENIDYVYNSIKPCLLYTSDAADE